MTPLDSDEEEHILEYNEEEDSNEVLSEREDAVNMSFGVKGN